MVFLLTFILVLWELYVGKTQESTKGGGISVLSNEIVPAVLDQGNTLKDIEEYPSSYIECIRDELTKYLGHYIKVYVMGALRGRDGFSGFLLKVGTDYIEILCFTYYQINNMVWTVPYIVDIPIEKLTAITHRP